MPLTQRPNMPRKRKRAQAAALAAALPLAPCLTSLDASGNYLGPEGAHALAAALLASIAAPQHAAAAGGCAPPGAAPAHPGCRLRRLLVSDNVLLGRYLSDKGQSYDGAAAPDFRGASALLSASGAASLTLLDLSHNHIGPDGAAALAGALRAAAWPSLSLVLGFSKLQADGVVPILAALRRPLSAHDASAPLPPPALRELNLRNNNLRPGGAAAVADALRIGTDGATLAVASLILLNNHLLAEGGELIGASLSRGRSNPWVRSLDVSSNCLGAAGVSAFAAALYRDVCCLEELSLHRNNAGDAGAAALAAALGSGGGGNTRLRALRLSNNHVHSAGGAALARALATNGTLARVDLSRNHFTAGEEAAILEDAARGGCAGRQVLLGDGPI
jgi:Ran GTPase-activating protein (RanGAP) involved in mRNA processing and transport